MRSGFWKADGFLASQSAFGTPFDSLGAHRATDRSSRPTSSVAKATAAALLVCRLRAPEGLVRSIGRALANNPDERYLKI